MFEVGFTEIVLILGLALLVLGPEKLPSLAEKVGRWTGRARAMARQLRTQLEHEVTMEELSKSRPMQAPPQTDDPTASSATPQDSQPGQPAPESDLDKSASGIDPTPAPTAAAAEPAATGISTTTSTTTSTTKPAQ